MLFYHFSQNVYKVLTIDIDRLKNKVKTKKYYIFSKFRLYKALEDW